MKYGEFALLFKQCFFWLINLFKRENMELWWTRWLCYILAWFAQETEEFYQKRFWRRFCDNMGSIFRFRGLALVFVDGRMNSNIYQKILKDNLLPFLQRFHRLPWIFQQDNATNHVSRSTRSWFRGNNVNVMEWPAKSPNLNIMENVWGIRSREVYADCRQFNTVEELREAILCAWSNLTVEQLKSLYESLPKRMIQLLKRHGNVIK